MKEPTYSRFDNRDLVLRDKLSVDRTLLANERTLLAYLRSAAALVIAGASIVHFSTQDWFWSIGILCIPIGIVTGILGAVRYRRRKISISAVRKHLEAETLKPRGKDS